MCDVRAQLCRQRLVTCWLIPDASLRSPRANFQTSRSNLRCDPACEPRSQHRSRSNAREAQYDWQSPRWSRIHEMASAPSVLHITVEQLLCLDFVSSVRHGEWFPSTTYRFESCETFQPVHWAERALLGTIAGVDTSIQFQADCIGCATT